MLSVPVPVPVPCPRPRLRPRPRPRPSDLRILGRGSCRRRLYSLRVEIRAARRRGMLARPPSSGVLWWLAVVLVALYAAHQAVGLGGKSADDFFNYWVNGGLLWGAALACVAGALRERRSRAAWVLVSLALASWATGDTIWNIRFGHAAEPPLTSASDIFWLAWYPLIVAALALLVRDRVPGFQLHRWIDGVVVMLIVATPWVALFLQPVVEHSGASACDCVVDFSYPLADAVLVGATLGVFALMGWRPGRMWLALGVALTAMGVADATYSVQALGHTHERGISDPVWAAAAVLIAFAAWQPHPGKLEEREKSGWSAIALPLTAQALAASIQIYGLFHEIPRSERVLTAIVLVIAMVQIVLTRPRLRAEQPADDAQRPSGANGIAGPPASGSPKRL
jgi:hypothetical protein